MIKIVKYDYKPVFSELRNSWLDEFNRLQLSHERTKRLSAVMAVLSSVFVICLIVLQLCNTCNLHLEALCFFGIALCARCFGIFAEESAILLETRDLVVSLNSAKSIYSFLELVTQYNNTDDSISIKLSAISADLERLRDLATLQSTLINGTVLDYRIERCYNKLVIIYRTADGVVMQSTLAKFGVIPIYKEERVIAFERGSVRVGQCVDETIGI